MRIAIVFTVTLILTSVSLQGRMLQTASPVTPSVFEGKMISLLSKMDLSVNMLYRTFTKKEPTASPVNVFSLPHTAPTYTAESKECTKVQESTTRTQDVVTMTNRIASHLKEIENDFKSHSVQQAPQHAARVLVQAQTPEQIMIDDLKASMAIVKHLTKNMVEVLRKAEFETEKDLASHQNHQGKRRLLQWWKQQALDTNYGISQTQTQEHSNVTVTDKAASGTSSMTQEQRKQIQEERKIQKEALQAQKEALREQNKALREQKKTENQAQKEAKQAEKKAKQAEDKAKKQAEKEAKQAENKAKKQAEKEIKEAENKAKKQAEKEIREAENKAKKEAEKKAKEDAKTTNNESTSTQHQTTPIAAAQPQQAISCRPKLSGKQIKIIKGAERLLNMVDALYIETKRVEELALEKRALDASH